jgi:hypothetical protein
MIVSRFTAWLLLAAALCLTAARADEPAPDGVWWSLRPLQGPAVPAVRDFSWLRTPVDAFILARLEAAGLKPGPEGERITLIRRLSYDLHGLPPTPDEVDAFAADPRPDAYERLVDRLLASPRYGERWGRHWLDVVHYGDTHGYDKDKRRDRAWPYRDYVIRSFNDDKHYADFVREQLAGDVLHPERADGVIATGFVAAGPWDYVGHVELREGTVDKLKTQALDRDDMVATTFATFQSLTVACARCHDHKFDPIPQADYYRLQAVFAGVERGERPYPGQPVLARTAQLEEEKRAAASRLAELRAKVDSLTSPELARLNEQLEDGKRQLRALSEAGGELRSPSNGYHSAVADTADVTKWVQVDLGGPVAVDQVVLVPARPVDFPDTPGFGFPVRFRIDLSNDSAFATFETVADHTGADLPNPGDSPVAFAAGKTGRYVRLTAQRLWRRTGDYVLALAEMQVGSGGKNVALGRDVAALDAIEFGLWARKYLVDGFDSRRPLPDLSEADAVVGLKRRHALREQIAQAEARRRQLVDGLTDATTRSALAAAEAELGAVTEKLKALPLPQTVYAIVPRPPRPVHRLLRGNVEQPKEECRPGGLSCLPAPGPDFLSSGLENEGVRRLALADWIADRRNPLTWRSIVNRVWQYHFGRGIVDTPNDFGANGSPPTHPELLDWLALHFRANGQSLKDLHRLLLTSAAYRQASRVSNADAHAADADNRLLWRMNRQRLDAESLRDAVLAVSGRLDQAMDGPGFDLFRYTDDHSPTYDHETFPNDHPATRRRTVYRFVVRSVPNPFLDCLDCADPNVNTPVRNTTLTALQALALLNDPFILRQAGHFADRLRTDRPGDVAGQVDLATRLALGRHPTADEYARWSRYVEKHGLANACRLLFNANEFVFID